MGKCPIVLDRSGQDIHAEGRRLRAEGPVTRVELPGGFLAWSVTSYETAKSILTDERFSKDPRRNWPAFINGEVPPNWEMITWAVMDNMTTRDGADHTRLRRLVSPAFTTRQVEMARPQIEKIVNELLDAMAEQPAGSVVDFKAMFGYPLPARVICDLFGVPAEARDTVLRGSQVNSNTTNSQDEAEANVHQWHQAMTDLVAYKQEHPSDDLTSLLISSSPGGDDNGRPLTAEEMVGTLHLMLGAGSETLSNVLVHAVLDILTHPEQRALVENGEYTWGDVMDETVRKEGAVAQLPFRYAAEDVEIGGVHIAQGDLVLIAYAAVGRDPEVHGDTADDFDITRADKTNLSFGYGAHRCVGMPLAVLQASIALPAVFERFPDMRLAVPVERLRPQGTFIMNGFAELPVHLTA